MKKLTFGIIIGLMLAIAGSAFAVSKSGKVLFDKKISFIKMERASSSLKVFFSTEKNNENFLDCSKVDSVTRSVPKTEALAKAALDQLFIGPTALEKEMGYRDFAINGDLASNLKRIFIKGNTAYLDWKDITMVIPNSSTSCGSARFFAPIESTLKQFPNITNVIQAINGEPSAFYNWMQIGCPYIRDGVDFCDETPYN